MKLTLKEFKEEYSYSPIDLEELAELASMVDDAHVLSNSAKMYIASLDSFRMVLKQYNIELG